MQRMNDLDPTLLRFAERAVAQIPVPPRTQRPSSRRSLGTDVAVIATALVLVSAGAYLGGLLRETRSGAGAPGTQSGNRVEVTPPAEPTVINGRTVMPLPTIYRNERFGYNLLLPAGFRRAEDPGVIMLGGVNLEVFTGRTAEEEALITNAPRPRDTFRYWDLYVTVWYDRDGKSAEEWARTNYGCSDDCTLTRTTISGTTAVVGTHHGDRPGKTYLIERGEGLLTLVYRTGPESERPRLVTVEVLDRIIGNIGLVPPVP